MARITLKWIGTNTNLSYRIPAFTMVKDTDSNYVYTLLNNVDNLNDKAIRIHDMTLNESSPTPLICQAMEGIATQYSINNATTITYSMLDKNNRLYFPYRNVAQNGIFIQNVDADYKRGN